QRANHPDPSRDQRTPRRADIPLTIHRPRRVAMRRDHGCGDRRLPPALPQLPGARRRRRPMPRRGRIRKVQARPVQIGVRPPTTQSVLHPRRLKPPPQPPGPPTSTSAPAPEVPATHTPPATPATTGAKSSGAPGKTTTPTTPNNTPPSNTYTPPEVDTGGLIAP